MAKNTGVGPRYPQVVVLFGAPGGWGPNAMHQLVAPHAWRLPFERAWRAPNPAGS